jgi:hypothetical protein
VAEGPDVHRRLAVTQDRQEEGVPERGFGEVDQGALKHIDVGSAVLLSVHLLEERAYCIELSR